MIRYVYLFLFSLCLWEAKAQQTEVFYLSGKDADHTVTWDFWCSSGMKSGSWEKIQVPSCWEQQGFGGYTYGRYYIYKDREKYKQYNDYREHDFHDEYGIYRHRFSVPGQWRDKRIRIVFEGVMTDADVKVNGVSAGPVHQGGFYRFSYDITELVKFKGKNTLEVTVHKQSADPSVNAAERRADWWLFGGIYRPVYLEAKPRMHIERFAVDARADGTLHTDVFLEQLQENCRLELALSTADLQTLVGRQVCKLSTDGKQTLTTQWAGIKTWDPEHPNLYRLTLKLIDDKGAVVHEVTDCIGFRTIDFRPADGIYLNGTRLLVKGTNRHCFDPEKGRTVSPDLDLKDALFIKQMNMNAVRSHYPPDKHFLHLCDSLGLLYVYELCGWQNHYSDTIALRLLPEMITRDVNHPCIFLWGNGNEGGWNTTVDRRFADYDPQHRHVIHPWADFDGLDTRHYPTGQDNVYRMDRGRKVFMMTEFLHGLYDRGQGAGLDGLWAKFCSSPLFAGGFLWAYVDEALHRTDTGEMDTYGPNAPDGIVSADRQKEGSFYTVREVWSPVQIEPFRVNQSFCGQFRVTNNYLFTSMDEVSMKWRVWQIPLLSDQSVCLAEGDVTLPSIAPGETGTARFMLPEAFQKGDVLELEAYGTAGDTVCTWTYPIRSPHSYVENYLTSAEGNGEKAHWQADGNYVTLEAGHSRAVFNRSDGMLVRLSCDGQIIPLSNGPLPVGMKAQLQTSAVCMQGDTAVYAVKYAGAVDSIVWRMTPSGLLGMDAVVLNRRGDFYDKKVYNLGFTFSYPENEVKGMRWLGRGPYRVWKNRIRGTRYGIWQKTYNNTVTGEYHIPVVYPEFKGYHGDLYWVTLQSGNAPLTVYSETEGLYLRVFTPEESRDREDRGMSVVEYPAGDLSFLLEIPAVNSQGTGGEPSSVKINVGDEGSRIKIWFDLRNHTDVAGTR